MGVIRKLARERARDELRVALIGAGFVGRDLTYQLGCTPGMRCALVVNRSPANAVDAYRRAGLSADDIVVSEDPTRLRDAIEAGKPAVTSSVEVMCELESIEIVMEALGSHEAGAVAIRQSLEAGKDVVSMNAEADATVGYLLKTIADQRGLVYTIADGDQPGVLARLIEFVAGAGFEIVTAVNCKGFMDIHATPESIKQWSVKQGTSPAMTTAFTDGTKMNIEAAVVANAYGLHPEVRGMHGVRTELATVTSDMMAVLSEHGSVEYSLGGDFKGGVFVIGYNDDGEHVQGALRYLKMGDGPYYTFYRPYHLVHIEAPISIAEAYLCREPTIAPAGPLITEVVTIAKKDLRPGDTLDGMGGWTVYGQVDRLENTAGLVPIGLIDGARITKAVKMGEPIPLDAVELDVESPLLKMRAEQDALSR